MTTNSDKPGAVEAKTPTGRKVTGVRLEYALELNINAGILGKVRRLALEAARGKSANEGEE